MIGLALTDFPGLYAIEKRSGVRENASDKR